MGNSLAIDENRKQISTCASLMADKWQKYIAISENNVF